MFIKPFKVKVKCRFLGPTFTHWIRTQGEPVVPVNRHVWDPCTGLTQGPAYPESARSARLWLLSRRREGSPGPLRGGPEATQGGWGRGLDVPPHVSVPPLPGSLDPAEGPSKRPRRWGSWGPANQEGSSASRVRLVGRAAHGRPPLSRARPERFHSSSLGLCLPLPSHSWWLPIGHRQSHPPHEGQQVLDAGIAHGPSQ